jgi:hypothetical protein
MAGRLKKLTREEHQDVARLLCGAISDIGKALEIAGPAVGARRLDIGLKAKLHLDVRLVMHLQDAWDDDFGGDGNPYRAAIREQTDAWYAAKGISNPFPRTDSAP